MVAVPFVQAKADGHENATPEEGPWLFTLDFPSFQPVLSHAKNRWALDSLTVSTPLSQRITLSYLAWTGRHQGSARVIMCYHQSTKPGQPGTSGQVYYL